MKLALLIALLFSFHSFADDSITVKGQIVQEITPHSYQGPFVFTPNTTVTIKLSTCTGEDGRCYTAVKKVLSGDMSFPIPFEISAPKGVYALDVTVRSQGGKKTKIGDLINEYFIGVTKSMEVTVKASGLESCQDANSGGFCLDSED